jgi:hypothetical protein
VSKIFKAVATGTGVVALCFTGLLGTAHADDPVPTWGCKGGSSKSPDDPGGRDVRAKLDSNEKYGYAEVRFIAKGEHVYFNNYTGVGGEGFNVRADLWQVDNKWNWRWHLSEVDNVHDNLDLPEGQEFQTEVSTTAGQNDHCVYKGGRT